MALKTLFIIIGFSILTLSYSQDYSLESYRQKIDITAIDLDLIAIGVLYETNVIRYEKGLSKLVWNDKLNKIAWIHAAEMNKHVFFNHTNNYNHTLKTLADRIDYINYNYLEIGENIYYSYIDKIRTETYQELCKRIISDLIKSKEHRKNLLLPNYTEMGVGIVLASKKDTEYVYFYLTQDFGKQKE